ncbi:group II intron maturase-specific domain-containing protein, partial [Paenibacillus sp. MCAF20]
MKIAKLSLERVKEQIITITSRNKVIPIEMRIKELNQYLTGWCGHYALTNVYRTVRRWCKRKGGGLPLPTFDFKEGEKVMNQLKEALSTILIAAIGTGGKETALSSSIAAAGVIISGWLGGWDKALQVLLLLMLVD